MLAFTRQLDVADEPAQARLRLLRMTLAGHQLLHAKRDARAVVVDDRHLTLGVDVVAIRGHPVERVIRPQALPFLVAVFVRETRFMKEELLRFAQTVDGYVIEHHNASIRLR